MKLNIVFVLFFLSFSVSAADIYCGFRFNSNTNIPNLIVSPDYSASLSVGEDTPAGAVLFWRQYTAGDRYYAQCVNYSFNGIVETFPDTFQDELIENILLTSAPLGGAIKDDIFPTNVYGIGVRISEKRRTLPIQDRVLSSILMTGGAYSNAPEYSLELIKTVNGPVGTGVIYATDFPVYSVDYKFRNNPQINFKYGDIIFNGQFNIVGGTCKVQDVDVPLGSHKGSEFTGIGSTTEWKDFSIKLTDCPTFYGNSAGKGPSNSLGFMSRVSLKLECLNPVTANGEDACETDLLPSGESTGLGVEIFDVTAGWSIMYYGTTSFLDISKTGNDLLNAGSVIEFPFKARYRQTRDKINGGEANLTMQFTITYE